MWLTRLPLVSLLLDFVMCMHFLCTSSEYTNLWMLREDCPVPLASQKMFPERMRNSLLKSHFLTSVFGMELSHLLWDFSYLGVIGAFKLPVSSMSSDSTELAI